VGGKQSKKKEEKEMRFAGFYDEENFGFESSSDSEACPWYMRVLMDKDTVHMTVSDLSDPERCCDEYEYENEDKKVSSDFIAFLLYPSFLRSLGYDPTTLIDLRSFKRNVFNRIKTMSPDLSMSQGKFRNNIQDYLNRVVEKIYYCSGLEDSKVFARDILVLVDRDFDLGLIDESDLSSYSTSYTAFTKVLFSLGLFDPERELRNTNFYLKKVPYPNGWDYKTVLEAGADFISSAFYRSFLLLKESPSDRGWDRLYDNAERFFSLIDKIIVKVPSVYIKNQKGEVWELRLSDFFRSVLRKKLLALVDLVPVGLREEFLTFYLPEDVQKILNSRVTYRPWKKKQ
jgi:hypothetical protein